MDAIASQLNSVLYTLRVMERMLHGGENWFIRLENQTYPGWTVCEDYFGLRIRPYIPEPMVCSPVLLCGADEIMYHHEINVPAQITEFTWWFSGVPTRV